MLQSVRELYGNKLGALDGEIGHVKDFYFDDQNWAIRYLVADTDSWLPGRQVLISRHALESLNHSGEALRLNLTRKQIENSPLIELHKPLSRQSEEEYCRYYGWPCYWQGEGPPGKSGLLISKLAAKPLPTISTPADGSRATGNDPHLRATRAADSGGHERIDWKISDACDYMIDPQSWAIRQVVIKTGRRLSCQEIGIPAEKVEQIAWDKSTMLVSLMKAAIEPSSASCLALAVGTD